MLFGGGNLVGFVFDFAGGDIARLGSGMALAIGADFGSGVAVAVGTGVDCVDKRGLVAAGLAAADFGGNT